MTEPVEAPSIAPGLLAADLRATIGGLVRATRTTDRLAPIPGAVLQLLDRHGPMTTADLAASRGVRHQTMAGTVRELIEAGYVGQCADPADARKKILTLTPAGSDVLDADRHDRTALLARALAETLDADERRAVARALPLFDRMAAAIAGTGGPAADRGFVTGAW
jgi:DNA-binding MarR family transcriptional regulator